MSAVARGGVWSTDGRIARTLVFFFGTAAILLALSAGGVGCGGDPPPTGGGPQFLGDLQGASEGEGEGAVTRTQAALTPGDSAAPRIIYLDYADGTPLPKTPPNACHATAPRFRCEFGLSLLDCQRQIQAFLDRWYADFNVVFTLERPASGTFNTVVVSSGGAAWCGLDSDVAGAAPFLCDDIGGGAVYAFRGGEDPRETAVIIAQEQAHLVGLEHTANDGDLMSPTICETCDGFQRTPAIVLGDRCNRQTQSSYQMMMDRLGPWPGGPKPSAFGCQADSQPPAIPLMEPADQSRVGSDFTVRVDATGDCDVARVDVAVSPQILRASATAPPYKWDLSNISGRQNIVVTVTDVRGHSARRAISVIAGGDGTGGGGCAIAGRTPSGGGHRARQILPSIALMLAAAQRTRGARVPARRRSGSRRDQTA